MNFVDYLILAFYFTIMTGIGIWVASIGGLEKAD